MSRRPFLTPIDRPRRIRIDEIDTSESGGLNKEEGVAEADRLGEELAELANLMGYVGDKALLVVLQGRDASGKDGAIRKILEFSDIQIAAVRAFKVPSSEERAHDFLWRVHRVAPARGKIALFNRSHYEDVIAARVHRLVPPRIWRARFDHINAFERLLVGDSDVIVLKFFLHVSREEQIERLIDREKDPRTAWKLNPADWRELPLWSEVSRAYDDVLRKTSFPHAPWYVVPADKKWFRNLAIIEQLVLALRPYRKTWLVTLKERRQEAIKQIQEIRAHL